MKSNSDNCSFEPPNVTEKKYGQMNSESLIEESEPAQATGSKVETQSTSRESFTDSRTSQVSIDMQEGEPEMYCTSPSLRTRMARKMDIPALSNKWIFRPRETLLDYSCVNRSSSQSSIRVDDSGGADVPQQIEPWSAHTHPDGLLYFSRKTESGRLRFLTEENLYDHEREFIEALDILIESVLRDVKELDVDVDEEMSSHESQRTADKVLVDVFFEFLDGIWYYYMADHRKKRPFWLQNFDASWFAGRIGGVGSKAHLSHALTQEYWLHVEHFPHDLDIAQDSLDELLGIFLFGSIDATSSVVSTMFFEPDEASRLREFVENFEGKHRELVEQASIYANPIQEYKKKEALRPFINASAARLLAIFSYTRFANFSGHFGARISRNQSIRSSPRKRSAVFTVLSILLLFAPVSYLQNLEEIWVDMQAHRTSWTSFRSNTEGQWQQFILYATVVLTSNMAFLALPAVAQNPHAKATPSQIISQVSIINSMGSIIVGLMLLRQYSLLKENNMGEVKRYFMRQTGESSNLESLAIIYSLPYALLFWGMISFLVAIAVTCFQVHGFSQQVVNGIAWLCVIVAVTRTVASGSQYWRGSFVGTLWKLMERVHEN